MSRMGNRAASRPIRLHWRFAAASVVPLAADGIWFVEPLLDGGGSGSGVGTTTAAATGCGTLTASAATVAAACRNSSLTWDGGSSVETSALATVVLAWAVRLPLSQPRSAIEAINDAVKAIDCNGLVLAKAILPSRRTVRSREAPP
jgi:hypothetical protein